MNPNGTVLYIPDPGYIGIDSFEYSVCSTPSPVVCDNALVTVKIDACPTPANMNIISGQVFIDKNKDGINNDGGTGFAGGKVYLYADGNCNGVANANELKDSVTLDVSGSYQFLAYPEKTVEDDFDATATSSSCASGNDGTSSWLGNWTDAGDPSPGFCVSPAQTYLNTHAEMAKDGVTGSFALRLKNSNVSATRTINLQGATIALLTYSYRRASLTMDATNSVMVQASMNGSTWTTVSTITGNGLIDAANVTVYNQNITAYAAPTTYIRFLTGSTNSDNDTVYIDNISITYLKYPQCYVVRVDSSNVVPNNYFYHCFAKFIYGYKRRHMRVFLLTLV